MLNNKHIFGGIYIKRGIICGITSTEMSEKPTTSQNKTKDENEAVAEGTGEKEKHA